MQLVGLLFVSFCCNTTAAYLLDYKNARKYMTNQTGFLFGTLKFDV